MPVGYGVLLALLLLERPDWNHYSVPDLSLSLSVQWEARSIQHYYIFCVLDLRMNLNSGFSTSVVISRPEEMLCNGLFFEARRLVVDW